MLTTTSKLKPNDFLISFLICLLMFGYRFVLTSSFALTSSRHARRNIRTTKVTSFIKIIQKNSISQKLKFSNSAQFPASTSFRMSQAELETKTMASEAAPKGESSLEAVPRKKSKRKVGLVIGYLGTAYRGLQINRQLDAGPVTVEEVLEEALYKAGCISDANYGNLDKISWSRSSRTDKGVHAARLVVGGKLEVALDSFDEHGLSREVAESVNAHLPEDIRVFSCAKVPKAFRPREACSYREYEYWLPASYLTAPDKDSKPEDLTENIRLFTEVIKSFEGTHSFHNFQSSRSKEMRKKRQEKRQRLDEAGKANADNSNSENEETAPESLLRERIILKEMSSNMYSCTVNSSYEIGGERFLRIFIRGQSFLYNQIRMMVGAAMATATGVLPPFAHRLALDSPYLVPIPVAPPQGLMLVGQNFARFANAVLMDKHSLNEIMGEDILNDQTKRVQVLMSDGMVANSKQFEIDNIRPEIARAWQVDGVYSEWLEYAERFRMQSAVLEELRAQETEVREKIAADSQAKAERDIRRRLHKLEKGGLDNDSYREILPNQFSTELCRQFGLLPGKRVADIQRALVNHFVDGEIDHKASSEEIIEYVRHLSVERLAKEGSLVTQQSAAKSSKQKKM